jgi:hypothetical protein
MAPVVILVRVKEIQRAIELLDRGISDAQRLGSQLMYAFLLAYGAYALARAGSLR